MRGEKSKQGDQGTKKVALRKVNEERSHILFPKFKDLDFEVGIQLEFMEVRKKLFTQKPN